MRQIASMPSSGYSMHSTLVMQSCARRAPGPTDGPQVETTVGLAGLGHLARAIALRQHDHRAPVGLQEIDVRIHPPGSGRAERTRGVTLRRLGRSGVVDAVVLHVIGQPLARVDAFLEFRVGDIAGHDHRSREREPRADGVFAQGGADVIHRLIEVDPDDVAAELILADVGHELRRVRLELLEGTRRRP